MRIFPQMDIIVFISFFICISTLFWMFLSKNNFYFRYSDFRPTSLEKGQELVRLRIYQVYAWGVPLVISGVAAILDHIPKSPDDTFLRPRFGEKSCWFFGKFLFSNRKIYVIDLS